MQSHTVALIIIQSILVFHEKVVEAQSSASSNELNSATAHHILWDPLLEYNNKPRKDRLPPGFEVRRVPPTEDGRKKLSPPMISSLEQYPLITKILQSTPRIPLSESFSSRFWKIQFLIWYFYFNKGYWRNGPRRTPNMQRNYPVWSLQKSFFVQTFQETLMHKWNYSQTLHIQTWNQFSVILITSSLQFWPTQIDFQDRKTNMGWMMREYIHGPTLNPQEHLCHPEQPGHILWPMTTLEWIHQRW